MHTKLPPPVCFIHIPKTAGTSLAHLLARHYRDDQVSRARLLTDLGHDPAEGTYRLWHGHYGLTDIIGFVPAGTRFVTSLREPVARVLSLFHYWRSVDLTFYRGTPATDPNYDGVMLAIHCRDLDEFLATDNPSIVREISDTQTRYLSGSLHDWGEVSAEKALKEITEREILVARQDSFVGDASAIVDQLHHVHLAPDQIGYHNRQSYQPSLTLRQRDRINQLNPNDRELYHAISRH